MAAVNMSIKHHQTWDEARSNFVRGITAAEVHYGRYIKKVEWSEDRTSAKLSGIGYHVDIRLDEESVHAVGHVPFFVKLLEPQARKFIEQTLQKK